MHSNTYDNSILCILLLIAEIVTFSWLPVITWCLWSSHTRPLVTSSIFCQLRFLAKIQRTAHRLRSACMVPLVPLRTPLCLPRWRPVCPGRARCMPTVPHPFDRPARRWQLRPARPDESSAVLPAQPVEPKQSNVNY